MSEYLEISNKEYRKMEGISASDLKRMVKSMATYKYYTENPQEDTPALLFGRAFHKYCLEPSDFENEFIVIKDFNCSSKEGKQAYAEYVSNIVGRELTDAEKKYKDSITTVLMSCGKDFISESDYEKINKMRDALYATPFAKNLIYGEHEKSFFWDDEETGIKCKIRPDSIGKIGNQRICVDLKTCSDATTDAFMRSAISLNYDVQASHYVEGLKNIYGKDFKFVFIAIEKEPPYLVNILEADDIFMQSGRETRLALLETYKKCVEKDEYPALLGFSDDVQINSLGVPSWIAKTLSIESE